MTPLTCKNHGLREATHMSNMPCATRPYKETVLLCTPCALNISKIGFTVEPLPEELA